MKIIDNNPYRQLGVFANSPTRERVANEGRLRAFLRVGRSVTFPLDLPQYLAPIARTTETTAEAEAKLTLAADQIKYAQFWFLKVSPIDNIAFNHLFAGNISRAIEIWRRKEDFSSLQNRVVCALIQGDYKAACTAAQTLYYNYSSQFVECVSGAGTAVPPNLAFDFLDALCDEAGTDKILKAVGNADWRNHISAKAISPIISRLQAAVSEAQTSKRKGSAARYTAGVRLMNSAKKDLAQLKTLLPTTDLQYQMIADKVGLEILQCGIDYYNDSNESDAPYKTKTLQDYALSVVVGKMAKDRCQENVNILNNIIDNLPPKEVLAEDKAIKDALRKYSIMSDTIENAISLLKATQPHLQAMKGKLGAKNDYYLKASTIVVNNALGKVIEAVNATENDPMVLGELSMGITNTLKSILKSAWEATKLMDGFDMESDFKGKRYAENRSTLKSMCMRLGISTVSAPTPPRRQPTPAPSRPRPVPTPPRPTPTPPKPKPTPPTPTPTPTPPSGNNDSSDTFWACLAIVVWAILIIIATRACS